MTPAERIELSAKALRAAGYEITMEATGEPRYVVPLDNFPHRHAILVPDLTTPENEARVWELFESRLEHDEVELTRIADNHGDGRHAYSCRVWLEASWPRHEMPEVYVEHLERRIALLRAFIEARGRE